MLPEAILFDLDDTILMFDAVMEPAWRAACRHGAELHGGIDPERLYDVVRATAQWYWSDPDRNRLGRLDLYGGRRDVVAHALERMGISDRALTAAVAEEYGRQKDKRVDFFPGAQETLAELASRGVAMALLTNGEGAPQRAKVERFGLGRFFDTILIEGEIGTGKPEAAIFRRALNELGVTARDAWCVGDNLDWDVAGAQAVGVYAIWNDYRRAGLPGGCVVRPDRVICGIGELLE
jgi:putative hydrolase of the HAD superfamily